MDISKIPVASFVLFAISLAFSLAHLVFCFREEEVGRRISKPFCTLFLFFALVTAIPNSPLPYIGLFFGFLGDLLLLARNHTKPLVAGTLCFLANHIINIVAYCLLAKPHFASYIIITTAILVLMVLGFKKARKILKRNSLAFVAVTYFGVLLAEFAFCLACVISGYWKWLFLCLIGAFLFLVSDIILSYTSIKKTAKRPHFWIMITYLPAQILIVLGLMFSLV